MSPRTTSSANICSPSPINHSPLIITPATECRDNFVSYSPTEGTDFSNDEIINDGCQGIAYVNGYSACNLLAKILQQISPSFERLACNKNITESSLKYIKSFNGYQVYRNEDGICYHTVDENHLLLGLLFTTMKILFRAYQ